MASLPGPWSLPIFGNALQLKPSLHEACTELSKHYGEVFLIKLGTRKTVMLNGHKSIEQAFVTQTEDFAGRPEDMATLRAFSASRGGEYGWATYGEHWHFFHKLLVTAFYDFTEGSNRGIVETYVSEEAMKLVEQVLTKQTKPSFNAEVIFCHVTTNLLTKFMFGSRRELDDPFLQEFFDFLEVLWSRWGKCSVQNALPWLDYIIPSKMRDLTESIDRQSEIVKMFIDERNGSYTEGCKDDLLSYIKTEIAEMKQEGKDEGALLEDNLYPLLYDLYGTGQSTHYTILNWSFVYAVAFPEMQEAVQEEIDRVVGRDRTPTLDDRDGLPLTEAFLEEVCRHAAIVSIIPPHETVRDTVLGGDFNYAIPKGTTVFGNLHAVFNDPEQWEDPGKFDPRRFLKVDGKSLDREKVNSMMKFGGGLRKCTGYALGTFHMFLFFATIMHQCTLRVEGGKDVESLEGTEFPVGLRAPKVQMEMIRR